MARWPFLQPEACEHYPKKFRELRLLLTELHRAIVFSIFRLIWAVLLLKNEDFSYVKMQACCFGVTELATGLMVSCLFVLPRLYRHVTAQPPYDSEEHRLRKWKKLASMSKGGNMNDSEFQQFPP